MVYAPPGSGYASPEDEKSELPDTYEPMMEFPGTMRPGRTPENQPFHDLPIGDNDPDPVPWPHFQQIEWHHRWEPPHPHPIPMEEFIEMSGRWATPEMEAAMRAGVRRDVRKRREQQEAEKRETLILDDEEDEIEDDDFVGSEEPVELGDGVFGKLGSAADQAVTAAAASGRSSKQTGAGGVATVDEEEGEAFEDDDLDDFLLDLGLDALAETTTDDDEDEVVVELENDDEPSSGSKQARPRRATKMADLLDDDDGGGLNLGGLDLLAGDDDGEDGAVDLDLDDDPSLLATDIDTEIGLGLDDEDDLAEEVSSTDLIVSGVLQNVQKRKPLNHPLFLLDRALLQFHWMILMARYWTVKKTFSIVDLTTMTLKALIQVTRVTCGNNVSCQ
jgi:hypothetical protein